MQPRSDRQQIDAPEKFVIVLRIVGCRDCDGERRQADACQGEVADQRLELEAQFRRRCASAGTVAIATIGMLVAAIARGIIHVDTPPC